MVYFHVGLSIVNDRIIYVCYNKMGNTNNIACWDQNCASRCCNYYGYCPNTTGSSLNRDCYYYYYDSKLSTGALVGIIAGIVALIVIITLIVCCCRRREEVYYPPPTTQQELQYQQNPNQQYMTPNQPQQPYQPYPQKMWAIGLIFIILNTTLT